MYHLNVILPYFVNYSYNYFQFRQDFCYNLKNNLIELIAIFRIDHKEDSATALNIYMKKITILFLVFTLVTSTLFPSFAEVSKGSIVGETAVLIDGETGQVLFDKDAHKQMRPASTTKILTALIILQDCKLDEEVTIDTKSPFTEGSRIYINEGEVFTIEQLLYALLLESANDVALALAIHHSGSVEEFAKVMNERAKSLGAVDSYFENPNGLDTDKHRSSAYDLALIAREAMKNAKFREIVKTASFKLPPTNKQSEVRNLINSNRFLFGTGSNNKITYRGKSVDIKYDLITGIKTGYTTKSGQCIVNSIESDGKYYISAVMNSQGKNIYVDSRSLLDYGLESFQPVKFFASGEKIADIGIGEKQVNAVSLSDLTVVLPNGYDPSLIEKNIVTAEGLQLPVASDTKLGTIEIKYNGSTVITSDLYPEFEVSDKELLGAEVTDIQKKGFNITPLGAFSFALKILLGLIIWRFLMTLINLIILRIRKPKSKQVNSDRKSAPERNAKPSYSRNRL